MEDKFKVRLRVVERQIVNWDEFITEFNTRIRDKFFPIVIKIDEGPDLSLLEIQELNRYKFLKWFDQLECDAYVETDNLIEKHLGEKHLKNFNELPFFFYKNNNTQDKKFEKKFMCFVGAHRWPRFVISYFLSTQHQQQSFITYWQDKFPTQDLKGKLTLEEIRKFKSNLPLYIETSETIQRHSTGYINFTDTRPLLDFYHRSFLDIVCETWHEGETFMPTEKIARPLSCLNPFVVYGPKNFLANLQRLGFKTFEHYWDESYDTQTGDKRIDSIKSVINKLAKLNHEETQKLYTEVLPILAHNKKLYDAISKEQIMKIFNGNL